MPIVMLKYVIDDPLPAACCIHGRVFLTDASYGFSPRSIAPANRLSPTPLNSFVLAIIVDSFTRVKENMGKTSSVPHEFYDIMLRWHIASSLNPSTRGGPFESEGDAHNAIRSARVVADGLRGRPPMPFPGCKPAAAKLLKRFGRWLGLTLSDGFLDDTDHKGGCPSSTCLTLSFCLPDSRLQGVRIAFWLCQFQ